MNITELKNSNRIIYECVAGSISYGLNIQGKSDTDIRGIYINPPAEYLSLSEPSQQISDDQNDVTYYSLKRIFELLQTANPNCIELLWMPDDCVKIAKPVYLELLKNRDLFISKKCFGSHIGYAQAQIQRARGKNKKVHNPQPETMPKKEDFCWVIPIDRAMPVNNWMSLGVLPSRPILLKEYAKMRGQFGLERFHVAALEHVPGTYRMYYYGDGAKGVFRGDDMLVCESIPMDDECPKFWGLLIYNQNEYERACKDWHSYWDWMNNRNEARWIDQEKGLVEYDCKNLMHCVRLLMSGASILERGYPIVRFEGEQRDYLMKIRNGEFTYEEIMKDAEGKVAKLEALKEISTIPYSVDAAKIEALYKELSS